MLGICSILILCEMGEVCYNKREVKQSVSTFLHDDTKATKITINEPLMKGKVVILRRGVLSNNLYHFKRIHYQLLTLDL